MLFPLFSIEFSKWALCGNRVTIEKMEHFTKSSYQKRKKDNFKQKKSKDITKHYGVSPTLHIHNKFE